MSLNENINSFENYIDDIPSYIIPDNTLMATITNFYDPQNSIEFLFMKQMIGFRFDIKTKIFYLTFSCGKHRATEYMQTEGGALLRTTEVKFDKTSKMYSKLLKMSQMEKLQD